MYQYTHQNYFEFGYFPDRKYSKREHNDEIFYANLSPALADIQCWRKANIDAALKVQKNLPGPYWLLLSGGTDSEVCARAFKEAGVPFQAITLRLADEANEYDIRHVNALKDELGIAVEFVDLNPEDFLQSEEFQNISNITNNISPIYAFHLWLASQVNGTPILAQGEVHLKKANDGLWYYIESERLCALYRYFILYDKPAVPGFFQYTPEQILSYLKYNPFLKRLINNEIEGKLGTRSSKNRMISQYYPEIEMRTKYTGFEKIEDMIDVYRKKLRNQFSQHDQVWHCEVGQLMRQLEGHE